MECVIPLRIALLVAFLMNVYTIRGQNDTFGRTENDIKTTEIIKRLIHPENMDAGIRPHVSGPPVLVKLRLYILSLSEINELHMDYTIDMFLTMTWDDPRLHQSEIDSNLVIHADMISNIWIPDLYFPNEKKAEFHDVTVPNKQLIITPNGSCAYSVRITTVAACAMDLTQFPIDKQECKLRTESFSFDTNHLVLDWDKIILDEEMVLPEMDLVEYRLEKGNTTYTEKDKRYSNLVAIFVMKRLYGFYILQMYIPSVLIVILSWVSFWIHIEAIPARVTLGVTTVLTMTTQMSGSKGSIPKVTYPKAIDVWMFVCLIFVFSALLEFAFASSLNRVSRKKTCGKDVHDVEEQVTDADPPDGGSCMRCSSLPLADPEAAHWLDSTSRWAFPALFLLFNLAYWSVYRMGI